MPNVPKVTEQERRLGPIPDVKFSMPSVAQEAFANEDLQRAQQQTSQLMDQGIKIAIAQKKYADDTVVNEADTKAGIIQAEIEDNIRKMRGRDAAGATDYLKPEWLKQMEGIEKGLSNESQKADFRQKNVSRYLSSFEFAKKHATTESEKYAKEVTNGSINQWRNTAVTKFEDGNTVDESIFNQIKIRSQEAVNNGLGSVVDGNIQLDDVAKKKVADDVSTTVAQVYNRLLLAGKTKEAEEFRSRYEKLLERKFGSGFNSEDLVSMDKMKTTGVEKHLKQQAMQVKVMQESNSKILIDEVLAGKFDDWAKLENLRAAGLKKDPSGITKEAYNWAKKYMESDPYAASKAKRMELSFGIPQEFFLIDTNADGVVDKDIKFADVSNYRDAVLDAYLLGSITKFEMDAKIAATDKVFNNGIATESFRNGQRIWQYYHNWFRNNMAGFQVQVGDQIVKKPLTVSEQHEALAFVGNGLMDYMRGKEIKSEDIAEVSQMLLGKYLTVKFPELVGKTELPNAIMDMEANFKSVYGGKITEADFVVQNIDLKKIPHDPMTQKVQIDRKTGKIRIVPK
jgi:hypothetical protein